MRRLHTALSVLVAVLAATACAAPAPPTAVPPRPAATATAPPAAAGSSARKEVEYVRGPRQFIVATIDALKKNDLAAARSAFRDYDAAWNGVEVYVNVRSRDLYNTIEVDDQHKIEELLADPAPQASQILPIAEDMLSKYDQAIKLSETGPALSRLFDDVTELRIARAELRKIGPALKANDPNGARAAYEAFEKRWVEVEELIKLRSPTAHREIGDALKKVGPALKTTGPIPAEAGPLSAALIERYNFGLSLVNAAARGADPARSAYTPADVGVAATMATIEAELRASLPLWEAGQYPAAGQHARRAAHELFDAASAPLAAKSADATLKKALDGYLAVAEGPGDQGKARGASKAALEAVAVAQQSLVGQFWSEPKLHGSILAALLTNLHDDLSKPATGGADAEAFGFQSAWGALQVAEAEHVRVEDALKAASPGQAETVAGALRTLKGAFPDAISPSIATPRSALGEASGAGAAALKSGLALP